MHLMLRFDRSALPILLLACVAVSCSSVASDIHQMDQPAKRTPEQKAAQIEPMLRVAGFVMLPADTPKREQQIANLPPLEISYYVGRTGKLHYWMADPQYCKCMYLGSEGAYQRYEQMQRQQNWEEKENATARDEVAAQ